MGWRGRGSTEKEQKKMNKNVGCCSSPCCKDQQLSDKPVAN